MDMEWEGKKCNIYVNIWPGAIEFLTQMTWLFEVVIFTASVSNYANPLVDDYLDSENYGFHKLYWEHCTFKKGKYVKDLSRMGREMKDLIIIDNLPQSYML